MCSCQNKINGIGRKRKNSMAKKRKAPRRRRSIRGLNSKDITGVATSAILGGAGAVLGKMVLDKILPTQYSQYTHYAQIAAGIGLAAISKNAYLQAAGLGMATVGASSVVGDLTDGIGLLPPGGIPQYRLAGTPESVKMM